MAAIAILLAGCRSDSTADSTAESMADSTSTTTIDPTDNTVADAEEQPDVAVDKAGTPTLQARTLRLVTNEDRDSPGGDIVTEFVKVVAELSQGAIAVEPTFNAYEGGPGWEQLGIGAVQRGEADLVYTRAGAFENVGVATVRALQLPGVIDSDEQADRVALAPVAGDVLAGFAEAGVVGLGLYPENLRHMAVFDGSPISAESIDGLRVRSWLQPTLFAWLVAAGADPVELGGEFHDQIRDGTLTGVDVSFAVAAAGILDEGPNGGPTVTANVSLYAKFGALAIGDDVAATLGDEEMALLTDAAAAALTFTLESRPHEAELAAEACAIGVAVIMAPDGATESLVAAAQPVIDAVANDEVAGPILDAVRVAAGAVEPSNVSACNASETSTALLEPSAGDLPNGVYRLDVNDDILAQYLPETEWDANRGVYTWTMKDGHYTWTVDWPKYPPVDDGYWFAQEGDYHVDGDQLTIAIPFVADRAEPFLLTASWSLNDDGSLTLEYKSGHPRWTNFMMADVTAPTWVRIGDA